jgi:hypothetical protein
MPFRPSRGYSMSMGVSKTYFGLDHPDTGEMALVFRNTFLNSEIAIFVISITDFIVFATFNK